MKLTWSPLAFRRASEISEYIRQEKRGITSITTRHPTLQCGQRVGSGPGVWAVADGAAPVAAACDASADGVAVAAASSVRT